jgi:FHA domain/RING-variant domain
VCLKTETWKRDSHGLFDYECTDAIKTKLKTEESVGIFRKNDLICLDRPQATPLILAQILLQDSCYRVVSINEPLWKVVRNAKDSQNVKGYILKQGDILKFGRVKYTVRELCGNPSQQENLANDVEVDKENSSCKICLSDQIEEGNPLISPCKCSGTMKFIHVQCLQMCVFSQMSIKTSEACKSYSWKSMHCSLCGDQFPYSVRAQGVVYEILAIERPEVPYFIIEAASQHGNHKGMHTVSLTNSESVTLGRGHDSDIRIGDISVSRCHAKIKYSQGHFILEDHNSKFGTLVQVNSVEINTNEVLSLQSGRTLLKFKLKSK